LTAGARGRIQDDTEVNQVRSGVAGQSGSAEAGERCRIVVADDNQSIRLLLATLLALEEDFELVAQATDGAEAVAVVERERPDLLVLDLAMPRMDGLEVLERLHATCPEVRIVVYSGYGTPEVDESARRLGAVACLPKGIPPDDLVGRLRDACREHD